jgi:hypothetical protein
LRRAAYPLRGARTSPPRFAGAAQSSAIDALPVNGKTAQRPFDFPLPPAGTFSALDSGVQSAIRLIVYTASSALASGSARTLRIANC